MRTVLVTGVSTGIGKSIAEELLKNNFYVIGSIRKEGDAKHIALINKNVCHKLLVGLNILSLEKQ